jgi:putative transposase
MCKQLDVSTAGYYKWRRRIKNETPTKNEIISKKIIDIHAKHRGVYGSPRVLRALAQEGIHCNHKRVERLMRALGVRAKQSKKFKATTNSKHNLQVAKNVLDRQFTKTEANQAWVSDITYVWTDEGWLYLVVFIDLWSRRVLGWSISERMQAEFVRDAFLMACGKRGGNFQKLVVHSDRGSQYASELFKETLKSTGCTQSMSRKANCWDNAVAESFFGSLKKELIYRERFETRQAARAAMFEYIEIFYNRIRLHSALNYLSPDQFERKLNLVA